MQFITGMKDKVAEFASENATTLLTGGGVVGVVGTAVLAWRGGYKYAEILGETREELMDKDDTQFVTVRHEGNIEIKEPVVPTKDKLFLMAPQILPPILTGTAAITAIIFSHKMSAQKAAALVAAYGLAERNLSEYKAKVEEKITGQKVTAINDELAQEAIDRTPGHEKMVIIDGEILCFDKSGGRYFQSSVERIKQAVNTVNKEIIDQGFASASSFYRELKLPANAWSDDVGFDMSNMIELTYSTGMAPGNTRTCFVFEFKNLPRTEYGPKYAD